MELEGNDKKVVTLGVLVVIVALIAAVVGAEEILPGSEDGNGGGGGNGDGLESYTDSKSGELFDDDSGPNSETHNFTSGGYDVKGSIILTWTDESDADPVLYENEGDEFTLEVIGPENFRESDTVRNDHGSPGRIEIPFDFGEEDSKGEWTVTVTCEDAGDQSWLGFGTGIVITDNGNEYSLSVEIEHYL